MHRCLFAIPLLLAAAPLTCQGTAADYERAAQLSRQWTRRDGAFDPNVHWLADGMWFSIGRGEARTFTRVGFDGEVRSGESADAIGVEIAPETLAPQRGWGRSSRSQRRSRVTFQNRFDRTIRLFWIDQQGRPREYGTIEPGKQVVQDTYDGHVWIADFAKDDLVGAFVAKGASGVAAFDRRSRQQIRRGAEPRTTERRAGRTFVRDHDVWLRVDGGEPKRLTDNGTEDDAYREPRSVSPDGRYALGFRVRVGEEHLVHFVESAPKDQLQPKLHQRQYRKPGDRIDWRRPVLFDLDEGARVPVAAAPFRDAWSVGQVHWAPDGSEVLCLYNRRGHQLLRIYAIDVATGAVRTVLEEQSDTFVDYSQKTTLRWLDAEGALLWASERDGFNHLYRVDVATGETHQVTKGDWLVRRVEHVDQQQRQIWFTALGMHPDQDPYHEHLARVGFDGDGLVVLTRSDGSHDWEFSPDRRHFVARWSRVDHPWVTELRRSSDGELVAELGRDDVSAMLASGYRPPERFVAKGRDGVTDIHGTLIVPSDFDPSKRYPVIEDIYAGPHGHFVPKRWGSSQRQRLLSELGFVVVQIDGMGTNWRSRAFHDVCWRNLKDHGLPDRIAWLRAAAETRPWLDLERVGIFGGSAGGQSSTAALLHHGDFYKVAVSDCGCHDNRMDKVWWNEAWMGWPIGPWYADCSNVTHAGKLQGKLLLTVAELDRNVDPATTMQVVDALIRADKDFDMIVVPGAGHGAGERPYLVRRRQDYFVRHLMGVEPRHR